MLPPGHLATGFLVGTIIAKYFVPNLDPETIRQFGYWGAFWGFAPDIDEFWFFYKNKNWLVCPDAKEYHRNYISHAPAFWAILGLTVIYCSQSGYWWLMGYIMWFSSWSHFILDSYEYGIMWLWPFSSKLYAVKSAGVKSFVIEEKRFVPHSLLVLKAYSKTLVFKLEVVLIIVAFITLIN